MEILRALPPHDNIIRLLYYTTENDNDETQCRLVTLFMEYLPSNLQNIIEEYPSGLPIALVQNYARQLLLGLNHLARQNIVHRDLSPRNILLDPPKLILRLADFGCAKVIMPDVPNTCKVGSWQYRAIELLFGAIHYGCQAGILFS